MDNLIDQCLDADLLKRPTSDELFDIINEFRNNYYYSNTEFAKQYKEAEEFNKSITSTSLNVSLPSYTMHPQAFILDFIFSYMRNSNIKNVKRSHMIILIGITIIIQYV